MMAGKLDRMIRLRTPTSSQDAAGQQNETMNTLADVPAQVIWLRGQEGFAASQKYAEAEVRFLIRHRTDVTPRCDVLYEGRAYDIMAVLEIPRRKGLDIYARGRAE